MKHYSPAGRPKIKTPCNPAFPPQKKCKKWNSLNQKNTPFLSIWFKPPTPNHILTKLTKWFLSRAINYLAPMKYMNCYQQMYVEL